MTVKPRRKCIDSKHARKNEKERRLSRVRDFHFSSFIVLTFHVRRCDAVISAEKGDVADGSAVAFEHRKLRPSRSRLPQPHRFVARRRRQDVAFRRESERGDRPAVARQSRDLLSRDGVPELYRLVTRRAVELRRDEVST